MTIDHKSYRHAMSKRVETKDDGRIIIYYTFDEEVDKPAKESNNQISADRSSNDSIEANVNADKITSDKSTNVNDEDSSPRPKGQVS